MDEPILGEGEEGPSIDEEGRVWVEGYRVKCPPLVCCPFEVPEVAYVYFLFERLEQELSFVPGELVSPRPQGGRVLCQVDDSIRESPDWRVQNSTGSGGLLPSPGKDMELMKSIKPSGVVRSRWRALFATVSFSWSNATSVMRGSLVSARNL